MWDGDPVVAIICLFGLNPGSQRKVEKINA